MNYCGTTAEPLAAPSVWHHKPEKKVCTPHFGLVVLSGPFFLLSVCSTRKRKNDNWLFFKQLLLTCTIILMNVLGLERYRIPAYRDNAQCSMSGLKSPDSSYIAAKG